MKIKRLAFILFLALFCSIVSFAQQQAKKPPASASAANSTNPAVKFTAAYAELILRKAELESALEDFSEAYTDENPKVKETRYQLGLIERDLARLLSFGGTDLSRMTLALGKLLVRRAELETDLWSLKSRYGDQHPDVKRAQRRHSSFDKAVREILP